MSLVTYAFRIPQELKDSLSGFEDEHGITAPTMLRLALFQMAAGKLNLEFSEEERERARGNGPGVSTVRPAKNCLYCGESFTPKTARSRFCKTTCSQMYRYHKNVARIKNLTT